MLAKQENYYKDFDVMMSHLGQMIMKKGHNIQSVHIAKTGSQ